MTWTDKGQYRPETLDDIIGQEHIKLKIKNLLKCDPKDLPHFLFKGGPGVGKTTMAEVIINMLDCDHKELNASDERGIAVVQGTIKNFARTKPITGQIRVLLLDESDSLTPEAQAALRRIMEKYKETCKFILTCNYPQKLIDPLNLDVKVERLNLIQYHMMKCLRVLPRYLT